MNIQDLIRYGVRPSLVDLWRSCGHEELLPVQRTAVEHYNLFGGGNLIVSAPTSSGKTFIGEMAAAHAITGTRKCFYLVPLKALASEKFETFRERYRTLGFRVAVSTRDYRQYDTAIEQGEFDMAIVVYEKMQQLLTRKPGLLSGVGLVVADELQVLADAERGAGIEVLLTRLKLARAKASFQFVGLSAVLKNSDVLSRWLAARFIEHHERPVELRRGILFQGVFDYVAYNRRAHGTEPLAAGEDEPAWRAIMRNAVHLARQGEQSLIFLADKSSARKMALQAAEEFHGPPASEAIEELMGMEETLSRQMLTDSLQSGIAFHNADLSLEERRIVERHFRSGSIRIICATPTLAVGVNLPAKNVFLEPMLWERDEDTGCVRKRHLTRAEYENMGGRAGRLSLHDDFGRSILVATTELERMQFRHSYFESPLEALEPQLIGVDLDTHVMNLVAARAAHDAAEIERFLTHTLTGVVHQQALAEHKDRLREKVARAVARCLEFGVVEEVGGRLRSTSLGRLCAVKGVAARTGHELRAWVASIQTRSFSEAEAVYALCRTSEARDQHLNMSTQEYNAWVYPDQLAALLHPQGAAFFGRTFESRNHQTYEEVKAMKMALVVHEWVQGRPALDIEQQYQSLAGTIRSAAETCSWLADAAAAIADLLRLPEGRGKFLQDLSTRLVMGVAQPGVALCAIRLRGFTRVHVAKLLQAGLATPDAVRQAPKESLRRLLGARLAERVRRALARSSPTPGCPATQAPTPASVPPDDPASGGKSQSEFRCDARFHFDGTPHERRTILAVNGCRYPLPNKTFGMLLRLAAQLHLDGKGWVRRDELGDSAQQFISNARKDLKTIVHLADAEVIENDGFGAYRLSVCPERVTFDWERIAQHWDKRIAKLAGLAQTGSPGRAQTETDAAG